MSNPQKFGTFEYEFEEAALLFSCSYGDGSQSQQADVQLYTTDQIPQGDPDLGGQPGIALKFMDGQTVKTILNPQDYLFYYYDQQTYGWTVFPFEQKLQALQQQYPQVQQQVLQQPQNDQNNAQVTMKMVLTDFNKTAKYAGSLTADYINQVTKDNFEIDEVFDHIKENIEKALEKNQQIELSLGDFCTLKATLKVQTKNNNRSFQILCQMKKVEIDPTEKEDINTRFQNKIINKIKNEVNQINQQQQQLNSNLSDQINYLNNRIQQLSLQVSAPKAQPKVISLAQLQQGQNGYYYSQNFQGFYEFRIVLSDHEVEFEIGVLRDGDFENLDVRAAAVYFELPDGKFRRGCDDSERVLSYPLFRGTIISVKVDTQKHIIQLALNDFDFAPLTLPQSIEQFAFLFKVTTQGAQISDYFESDQEVQWY